MTRFCTVFLAALVALFAGPAFGQAQVPCGERSVAIKYLAEKFGEKPVAMGLTAQGAAMEILASANGTWSVLMTMPGKPTCLVASGDNWQQASPAKPVRPERAL